MPDESTPTESSSPKSRKGLVIAIASLLVLGGGGAGAYFMFAGKEDAPQEVKEKDKKPAPVVKAPAQFVALDPPFVVNFQGGSSARFLQITVQLMTRDPELITFIQHLTPIIRNDLLVLYGDKQVSEVSTPEGKEALRQASLEAVRKVIAAEGGKPQALEAVYFTSFVMQ